MRAVDRSRRYARSAGLVLAVLLIPAAVLAAAWPAGEGSFAASAHHGGAAAGAGHAHPSHADGPAGNPIGYQQLRTWVLSMQSGVGSSEALVQMQTLIDEQPELYGVCAPIAREVAQAEARAVSAATALAEDNGACGGAYSQGVAEAKLANAHVFTGFCPASASKGCLVGVGKAAFNASAPDIAGAISLCRTLGASSFRSCTDGVFQHLWSTEHTTVDAERECGRLSGTSAKSCWFYAPGVIISISGDYGATALWCESLPPAAGSQCSTGLGARVLSKNPNDLILSGQRCQLIAGRLLDDCLRGMAITYSEYMRGTAKRGSFCSGLLDDKLIARCKNALP